MRPLVSIIMGVFNEEKSLSRCIDSIRRQSFSDWEFIICNDCSTDNTSNILKDYQSIDERIVVIENEKNCRLAASLNNCLRIAKGKYIARMDADDESLPDRLKEQVSYIEDHEEIDCVGTNRIMFDEKGDRGIRFEVENPSKDLLLKSSPFAHPTIMMRKSVYDELGGYRVCKDTMRAEDLDLWFRFFASNHRGYNIQKPLYRYSESLSDIKKRTLKAAIGISKVYLAGYKLLGFPKYKYIFALKPIIASIIPRRIMARHYKMAEYKS